MYINDRTGEVRLLGPGSEAVDTTARNDYKKNRMNGDEEMDAPKTKLPLDGKITRVNGKSRDSDRGGYEYECKYDEGPGDKKWMEECDRNYLARLYLMGANNAQERQDLAENKEQAEKAAKEVEALSLDHLPDAWRGFRERLEKKRQEKERQERERKAREERERQESMMHPEIRTTEIESLRVE